MFPVVIDTDPKNAKSRSFKSFCMSFITADMLWEGGKTHTEVTRPVWAMFAGSDSSLRPFSANLSLGKSIQIGDDNYRRGRKKMDFLKTAGFHKTYQREQEGTLLTVFLHNLFVLDPGLIDPMGINFIVLPSKHWVNEQSVDVEPLVKHLDKIGHGQHLDVMLPLITTSYLFIAYLDRRTRCPIIMDPRFYVQFLHACLSKGLASLSTEYNYTTFGKHKSFGFKEVETEAAGLCPGIAFRSSHKDLETLLADQTLLFFNHTKGE